MKDHKENLQQMFHDIYDNTAYNETVIFKYFNPDYIQEVDGKVLNFEQFCQHVKVQSEIIASMDFDFHTVTAEGEIVFSNHIVTWTKKNGEMGRIRVIAEFHMKNGKISYCNELTHMINGNEEDRDIGSRH